MNLDHDFAQVSKLSGDQKKVFSKNGTLFFPNLGEDQKKVFPKTEHFFSPNSDEDQKKSSSKMEHFFSPNSSGHLRSDAHQSQIIGGVCRSYSNYWGDTVKLLRDIYPPPLPPPRVSAPLFAAAAY